jgi:hypothetical protein
VSVRSPEDTQRRAPQQLHVIAANWSGDDRFVVTSHSTAFKPNTVPKTSFLRVSAQFLKSLFVNVTAGLGQPHWRCAAQFDSAFPLRVCYVSTPHLPLRICHRRLRWGDLFLEYRARPSAQKSPELLSPFFIKSVVKPSFTDYEPSRLQAHVLDAKFHKDGAHPPPSLPSRTPPPAVD